MPRSAELQYHHVADVLADPAVPAVYEAILADPRPSRRRLVEAGHEPEAVDIALTVLHVRDVIDATDPEAIEVAPPDVAIPAYAALLERQARSLRLATAGLAQTYHRVRTPLIGEDSGLIRRLGSFDEVTGVVEKLEESVRHSLYAVVAGGPRMERIVAGGHSAIHPSESGPSVEALAVIDASIFELDGAASEFSRRQSFGYDIRVGHDVPFNLLVVDRESAVIDTSNTDPECAGSVFVRDPTLVRALIHLFLLMHEAGMPLPSSATATGASGLSERDRLILTLLAAGTSDTVIARQAGVSQRTVERRIRAFMDQLGASTRFQTGVQAVRAGLI